MNPHLLALKDLFDRYRQVARAAWDIRHQLDSPPRAGHEIAFLPAHVEVAETPVHPAPLRTQRLIIAFGLFAVLWAIFGQVDVVAVAPGKLIPNVQVKLIQSIDSGIVRAIHVKDGQRVTAGQALLELDTTLTGAEADKTRSARLDLSLAEARAQALLEAQRSNQAPKVSDITGLAPERQQQARQFAEAQFNEYRARQASAQAELARRRAALETSRRQIGKLTQTAPLARQSADNYRALVKENYVSRQDYLEKEQSRIQQEEELAAEKSRARELEAAVSQQSSDIAAHAAQFRREQLDALNQAQQQLAVYRQEETKARERQARMKLVAPVAGTIQQLAVHTLGGVVQPAQALMVVVPEDTLEAEVAVENKDIGFVWADQEAVVKIESFPYTRYGYLTGSVLRVANDAAQDKKKGLVYPARIRLPANRIWVDQKWVNLTPGMAVTVEIKTGSRSVADYFLSPLKEYASESLRER